MKQPRAGPRLANGVEPRTAGAEQETDRAAHDVGRARPGLKADWHAAKAGEVAETAAKLNTGGSSAEPTSDGVPLVLLDPRTEEPYRNRRYNLEFNDKIIEGTTDQNGATKPLTAAERAAIVRWYIKDETTPI